MAQGSAATRIGMHAGAARRSSTGRPGAGGPAAFAWSLSAGALPVSIDDLLTAP
jgi:hypothetical protein